MHPRISVNAISSYRWTLDEDLAFYREIGCRHVGLMYSKLAEDVAGAVGKIAADGLRLSCMSTSLGQVSPVIAHREGSDAVFEALRSPIEAAHALGCPILYFVSGSTPSRTPSDEAIAALAATLKPAVAYAAERGVRLASENNSVATRFHGFVHTVHDIVRLSREADIDVNLELQNCWFESDLAAQFRENIDRIGLVQVSDFILSDRIGFNRAVPGDGDMPLEWLIAKLLEAGYAKTFDIEIIGPHIDEEGYASAITRSVAWLDEVLVRLGA